MVSYASVAIVGTKMELQKKKLELDTIDQKNM